MSFVKNNYKIIIFILIIFALVIGFIKIFNKKVSYEIEYDYEGYHVKESYNKDLKYYSFNISKDDYSFDYAFEHEYTRNRKLVEGVNSYDEDNYKCTSIKVYNTDSHIICSNKVEYYDELMNKKFNYNQDISGDFKIYDSTYDYYIWNGYGLTNMNDNTEYKFLSKESYSNELYYQFDNYILIADYDQTHSFNKLYIFDYKKKKVDTFDLPASISFDSYFMGNIGMDVFIYDSSNKVQYQLNIQKKKMRVSTEKGKSVYFDKNQTTIDNNKLFYSKYLFKNNKIYNYSLVSNTLYYSYYNSDKIIKVTDLSIKDLVYSDGLNAYFIVDEDLYKFDHEQGLIKLANYFEWNFNYLDKIFVFAR